MVIQDSLNKRFTAKLSNNLVKLALGFITIGLLPRVLGPETYGNYGYITNFYTRTIKFLSFGVPTAYYIKLSKRQHEKKIIVFFIYYSILLIFLLITSTFGFITVGLQGIIFPEQKEIIIYATVLLVVLNFVSNSLRATNDAFGYTVKYELVILVQNIMASGLVVLLYYTNTLTLGTYFLMQYFILLFVIISGLNVLRRQEISLSNKLSLAKKEMVRYIKEFYQFSHPLFINSLVVFFIVIADRWLLQYFYGSLEQGYYTLALRTGSIVFIFTSAMSSLLVRDMSDSFQNNNIKDIKHLFRKYIPLFYFVTAYMAVFISLNAETIIFIIGGSEYKKASTVLAVISLYPIHQVYGQLSGSVFLATEKTRILRNIGISTGLAGFIISLFLLSPVSYLGFEMGAIGLAIKMVLVQFITVNIILWFSARFLNLSFIKFFGHQLIVLSILFLLAKLSLYMTDFISTHILNNFIISGIIYSLLVLSTILLYPRIIVKTRRDLCFASDGIGKFDSMS
jgi:O-antigen/teichoic acid export membrane protein